MIEGSDKSIASLLDITERKRAEEEIAERRMYLEGVLRSTPDAIVTLDVLNRVVEWNLGAEKLFGYSQEEAVGQNIDHMITTTDVIEEAIGFTQRVLSGKEVPPIEVVRYRKDSSSVNVILAGSPILMRDELIGAVAVYTDITERVQAEETLRKYKHIISATGDHMSFLDRNYTYQAVNECYLKAHLKERREIVGHSVADLLGADVFAQLVKEKVDRCLSGEEVHYQAWFDFPGLGRRYMDVAYYPYIGVDGAVSGMVTSSHDITDLVQAEEALRESEQFLQDIFDGIQDGISALDVDLNILRVNAWMERLYASRAPLVGKKCYAVYQQRETPCPWCPSLPAMETGEEHSELVPYPSEENPTGWINLSAYPLKDITGRVVGVIEHVQDITERVQAEETLQKHAEQLEVLRQASLSLTSSLTMQSVLNAILEHSLKLVNADDAHIFLYDGEQLSFGAVLWKDDRTQEPFAKPRQNGLTYTVARSGKSVVIPDLSNHPLFSNWSLEGAIVGLPLRYNDKVFGVMNVALDQPHEFTKSELHILELLADQAAVAIDNAHLHEQVQRHAEELEQRVTERTQELRDAQEKMLRQERLATLGQIAGSMGHELRNPLGIISNAVYYLKMVQPDAGDKVKEYLDMIDSETRDAAKIISDLLGFARLNPSDQKDAAVSALVAETLAKHPPPANVEVDVRIPNDLPPLYVDPAQIGQVLANLIINAYQAMPYGGELSVFSEQCSVSSEQLLNTEHCILLTVSDTGTGIPPENMPKLFEPLFSTKPRGIGLGLAISKKLVEANGGSIEVESVEGQGSAFTLRLPLE